MDSKGYLTLNSWLQKSDCNYISGRLLWFNLLIDGACNLLWLSCEQIIKILLIQKKADDLSFQCSNIDDMHKLIDKEGKKLGHNLTKLLERIEIEYPEFAIDKYRPILKKLQDYFNRRYVVHSSSSISLHMIDDVDEFYFLIRKRIEPKVGLGTIDEIFIQRKNGWRHPISAFSFAYMDNKSFSSRKHNKLKIIGPDRKIYEEEGY